MEKTKRDEMIEEFYYVLDQWLTMLENGKSVGAIVQETGCKNIAIYGMGAMARHLLYALKNTTVKVVCVLDNVAREYYGNIRTQTVSECNETVDLVIYTNPKEDAQVLQKIVQKYECPVVSLVDVVFDNIYPVD